MMIFEFEAQYKLCALVYACLDLHSLSSKTSRYAHFGHNRLTVYRHPVSRLMLALQPQF